MYRISQAGLDFIKGFESFVPYVYDDLLPAQKVGNRLVYRQWKPGDPVQGTLTIGYGHTDAAKFDIGCKLSELSPGFTLTENEAAQILDVDLDDCEQAVNRLVSVPLEQGMFDAIVSLTFNMGEGNLRKSSLLAKLNRRDYVGARAALDLYINSKGKFQRGLQRRRDGEQELWDANIPRVPDEPVDHPAEVDAGPPPPPASMAQSTEGNAAILTGATGSGIVTDAAMNAAARVAERGTSWDSLMLDFLLALLASPQFWVGVTIVATSTYAWCRRKTRLELQGV